MKADKVIIVELDGGKITKIRNRAKGYHVTKDWIHVSHDWGTWSIPLEHVTSVKVLNV